MSTRILTVPGIADVLRARGLRDCFGIYGQESHKQKACTVVNEPIDALDDEISAHVRFSLESNYSRVYHSALTRSLAIVMKASTKSYFQPWLAGSAAVDIAIALTMTILVSCLRCDYHQRTTEPLMAQ